MVTAPRPAPPPWRVGNGNSPPAKKLPVLLFKVKTFGSARICSQLLAAKASMVAPRLRSGRKKKRFRALVRLNVDWPAVLVCPVLAAPPRLLDCGVGGVNCPVVTDPMVLAAPVLKKFNPNCCE